MEGVKHLEVQPRRTLRRRGSGMLSQETVEQGRLHTVRGFVPVTAGIRHGPKSRGMWYEKSEEVIVPRMVETTELDRREGPRLQPCRAGRYVTVHARKGQ